MKELPYSKSKQTGNLAMSCDEYKAYTGKEADLQRQCEEYLNVRNISYIRFPDAAYKAIFGNPQIGGRAKLLISSFVKGLPDITILDPIKESTECRALCIELKTKAGKQSQGQKNFARKVPVLIIRSFEEFVQKVEAFLNANIS